MTIRHAMFCLLVATFSGLKILILGLEFLGREFWGALNVVRNYLDTQVWNESKEEIPCSRPVR